MAIENHNFFVKRPIVAMVMAILTVIIGTVSITGLSMEQYPDITPPMIEVTTTYTGANALNVEQSVATPIEQEVNGVDNMIYMKSTNANDGSMKLQVSFDVGTDPDMNNVFTQNRASIATPKLPADVKQYGLKTEKSFSFPLMIVSLTSTNPSYDQDWLGNYSTINVKDILARTSGVGKVTILGSSDYSMRIWVKPDRLAQLGISIPEITNAIKQQNTIIPGGKFGGEPAPKGTEFTYTVQMPDRLTTPEEFGDIVIRTNPDGSQVKINHIARVELGIETYRGFSKLNGSESAPILIYQAPGSNAVEISKEINSAMEQLAKNFPDEIEYTVSLDTTKAITAGIDEIINTLIVALVLVVFVVYIFIQDWRATLVPVMAIPVSLIGAFILFPMLGFTINTLSLLGLVLAIGMVVDDAIVVVDAVQVNLQKGMGPKEATSAAMKEVTAPVIATTLVLVAVFIPVASMAGITGRLYQQFAITLAVSVVFSSVNALTLTPAMCSVLLRKPTPTKGPLGWFFGKFNIGFDKTTNGYMSFTNIVSRKITMGMVFIGVIMGGIFLVGGNLPGGFIPEEDQGYLFANIMLPEASSLQRSHKLTNEVEKILIETEGVEYTTSIAGFNLLTGAYSTNNGFIFIALKDWKDRTKTANEISDIINKKLMSINEATAFTFGPPAIPGLGSGSGFSMMIQDKGGNDVPYLAKHANAFIRAANAREEIAGCFTPFQANVPQRYIDVNTDKVLKFGVKLDDLYATIGAFLGGSYVNDFNRFGRVYKAYIQAEPEYRVTQEQMRLFFVTNSKGENVPLSSLVKVHDIIGPEFTNRFNMYRSVELMGKPAPGFTSSQALKALEEVAASVLPPDMGYQWANMSFQEKQTEGSGNIVFLFALIFVFLILAAQYESWSLPLAILIGTPFAIFGALSALYLGRMMSPTYENNVFAQISLVMLIAMAAKNAILIIEFANIEFEKGLSLFEAATKAARLRFRPILMTALSFILGVLPLLTASGSGAEARKVMGMALLGGMSLATLLGVFLTPMLFIFIGKLFGYEKKRALAEKIQTAEQ
jgi:HAE1 family hydrophobic/amphiphilic exporter-1